VIGLKATNEALTIGLQLGFHQISNYRVTSRKPGYPVMPLKVRKNKSPSPPEPCLLTHCMAVISGAWAVNVIWSLRAGPRRFNELRTDIPPISAKVLSTRLSELEQRGVLVRKVKATSPPSVEYSLTELGVELVPALEAIVEVGHRLKTLGHGEL
jgi:DNA-binding HxlR family transcriptional regulator